MISGDIMFNILAVGDVVGSRGCEFLDSHLRAVKRYYKADLTIVNGENSAPGNGITKKSAESLFLAGADIITTGNHVFARQESYEYLDEAEYIVRPANYHRDCPGKGAVVWDAGRFKVMVGNLAGTVFMESLDNPFLTADRLIREHEDCRIKVIDFHAETTSEKCAMAYYLDGRASVLFGTHTHVQTNDECIYPGGLGYITDVGMTGGQFSALGVDPKPVVDKFIYKMPRRFVPSENAIVMDIAVFTVDETTGKTVDVTKARIR
ncbi:MAG: TIGR00282 family metallophosphoesterase [Clostridia bacterium]|nr:TIGR00282 family metallophosphoesterase [Clostridia bacterium]